MEHLESRLFIAGMATPSPTPMHARANKRAGRPKLAARGVKTVAMLHQMTPNPSTVLPPYLSAHTPPATCVVKYPLSSACLSILGVAANLARVANSRAVLVYYTTVTSLCMPPLLGHHHHHQGQCRACPPLTNRACPPLTKVADNRTPLLGCRPAQSGTYILSPA